MIAAKAAKSTAGASLRVGAASACARHRTPPADCPASAPPCPTPTQHAQITGHMCRATELSPTLSKIFSQLPDMQRMCPASQPSRGRSESPTLPGRLSLCQRHSQYRGENRAAATRHHCPLHAKPGIISITNLNPSCRMQMAKPSNL